MSQLDLKDPAVAALEGAKQMQLVIREMREIPELPSEAPKDVQNLDRVELPPAGGVLTYMKGSEHPYHGFPFYEFVEKIDAIKKLSRGVLSGLYHELKSSNRLLLVTLLPALWFFKPLVRSVVYSFHKLVSRTLIKQYRYSDAIRELHTAFSYENESENGKTRQLRIWIRDIACMILEFDNAYRFRFQDAIEELDKDALRKNPIGELDRLLISMQSRELGQDVSDTWKLLRLFSKYYLRFDGEMRGILVDVLGKLDIEKVKLSLDDKYYCTHRKDFQPRFLKGLRETPYELLTEEQREDRLVIEKAHITKEVAEERTKLMDEFNTLAELVCKNHGLDRQAMPAEVSEEFKKESSELENKYNKLLEANKNAYALRVAEIKKLCQL